MHMEFKSDLQNYKIFYLNSIHSNRNLKQKQLLSISVMNRNDFNIGKPFS